MAKDGLALAPDTGVTGRQPVIIYVLNESYFFLSHRLELATAAADAGYEVHVAAPADHVWAPEGFSVDAIKEAGFAFHPIPLSRRGRNPWQEIRTLIALYSLYRRLRPAVIHHFTIKPNMYGGIAARLAGSPAVVAGITGLGQVFVDTSVAGRIQRRLVQTLLRVAFRHRNFFAIFQNVEDLESLVGANIVDRARAVLMGGSGVNLDDFPVSPEPPTPVRVVLASRLIWEKGVDDFVEAARILYGRGADARFVLVGGTHSSNPNAVPEDRLRRWIHDGVIEWCGHRTDMHEIYSGAHIVCLPTRYGEGVPKTLIEAAATGRPLVGSDTAACRAIIEDGVNGLIVPAGDAARLADAIQTLIADDALRRRFGAEGRKRVEREFDVERVVSSTLSIYEELGSGAPYHGRN